MGAVVAVSGVAPGKVAWEIWKFNDRYVYPIGSMYHGNPRETFIFRGYNPYIGGVKPSFFMVLGSHGMAYLPTFS